MKIFLDTSALFALLDSDDANHQKAKDLWSDMLNSQDSTLITTNYVVIENFALLQNRLGLEAVRGFHDEMLPLINVEWIDVDIHRAGVSAFLAASRRRLSIVDCVSFEIMRTLGIKTVFAFDPHFKEQGFQVL